MSAQPYTDEDLARGEKVVRELHGLKGYEAWAERIAKEIAATRATLPRLPWFKAHHEYHEASDAYNRRLELVKAERKRDNWTMNAHQEYAALNTAQSAALRADETLYRAMLAASPTPPASIQTGLVDPTQGKSPSDPQPTVIIE